MDAAAPQGAAQPVSLYHVVPLSAVVVAEGVNRDERLHSSRDLVAGDMLCVPRSGAPAVLDPRGDRVALRLVETPQIGPDGITLNRVVPLVLMTEDGDTAHVLAGNAAHGTGEGYLLFPAQARTEKPWIVVQIGPGLCPRAVTQSGPAQTSSTVTLSV